jgi:DNA-binding transcriptional regulator YdaS (Cro superfamily)
MEQRETYRNTLRYALTIVGNEIALAVRLRVTPAKLSDWLDGSEPIPVAAFLDAVDVVVGATAAEMARSREALLRYPADARDPGNQ